MYGAYFRFLKDSQSPSSDPGNLQYSTELWCVDFLFVADELSGRAVGHGRRTGAAGVAFAAGGWAHGPRKSRGPVGVVAGKEGVTRRRGCGVGVFPNATQEKRGGPDNV
ncbi:hypothetical protein NDU88_001661 [Pleurodeles waltl]|uniref:Uncharacterized protein n=1 Tax=Pleurodeles waltl TaxID=8319 RepID=A0AAV7T0L6_PLEWA|nr:hypothetical protein NDU88_001661 [Pleurodeles waltl]